MKTIVEFVNENKVPRIKANDKVQYIGKDKAFDGGL
jgi:hypothetical protein